MGRILATTCSKCDWSNFLTFNFCGQCGFDLSGSTETAALNEKERCTQNSDSLTEFVALDITLER